MFVSHTVRLQLVLPVTMITAFASAFPPPGNELQREAKPTPWIDAPIVPGEGFAGVRFGDSTDEAEDTLGEPDSGSERGRWYVGQGFYVALYKGKVIRFHFNRRFRGRLAESDIGIGSTLAEVEGAYGSIEKQREVDDLWVWSLHRVLVVRRNGPADVTGMLSRLCYEDHGLCFYFDREELVVALALSRKRSVATKGSKKPDTVSEPAWYDREPIREREGFAGVRFGDTPAKVEEVLGEASSGCDDHRRFTNPDIQATFKDGRLYSLRFGKDFRGRLSESGIGIHDIVDDVLEAYGEPLVWREVKSLSAWNLDRTFITQRGTPGVNINIVSKILYGDAGIEFFFDKEDRVVSILLSQPQPTHPAKPK